MKKGKVFVIGIDGGTWDIFDKLMDKGIMPNLKKLVDNNFSASLESSIPPVTAPAWSSFITGMNPDKHGVFDFAKHQQGNYQTLINNANSIKAKSLWKILSDSGKTVGVINVPMTYPPEEVNGFVIPGFLSPGVSKQKISTSPEGIIDEVTEAIGDYKIFLEMSPKATIKSAGKQGFLKKCTKIVNKRYDAAVYLYQKYQPDFFMVHFLMTDVVQHWIFHCLDESHKLYNDKESAELQNAIFDFYNNLDQKIGALLNIIDKAADVIILSDHGFGPLDQSVFLNRWLYENGYLKLNLKKQKTISTIRKIVAAIDFLNLRNRVIPSGEKRVALEKSLHHDFLINWKKTKAYASPASIYGAIYLNIKGREAEGLVNEENAGTLIKNLKKQLLDTKDAKTGSKIFSDVFTREEIYPNENGSAAPDVLVRPADGNCIFSQVNEKSSVKPITPWEEITGTHRMNGILVIKSDKVKTPKTRSSPARIIDLAPTILHLLGLSVPRDMDGTVLTDVLKEAFLKNNAVQFSDKNKSMNNQTDTGYSEKEEEQIRQRLQDLGYLE